MRTVEQWLSEYGESHQNAANKTLHWICVPIIVVSLIGLLWSLPVPRVFSEVSPRPHDTGLVTLISQDLSEFALHARAILGLPIPVIRQRGPSASCALLVEGESKDVRFENVERALTEPDTAIRLFGKPEVRGHRRMGVSLALGKTIDEARAKARAMTQALLEGVRL